MIAKIENIQNSQTIITPEFSTNEQLDEILNSLNMDQDCTCYLYLKENSTDDFKIHPEEIFEVLDDGYCFHDIMDISEYYNYLTAKFNLPEDDNTYFIANRLHFSDIEDVHAINMTIDDIYSHYNIDKSGLTQKTLNECLCITEENYQKRMNAIL